MSDTPSPSRGLQSEYEAKLSADLKRNAEEHERVTQQMAALAAELKVLEQNEAMLREMQRAVGGNGAPAADAPTDAGGDPAGTPAARVPAVRTSARKKPASRGTTGPKVPRARQSKEARAAKPAGSAKPARAAKKAKTAVQAEVSAKTARTVKAAKVAKVAKEPKGTRRAKSPAGRPAKAAAATGSVNGGKQKLPSLVQIVREHLSAQTEPRSAAEAAESISKERPERALTANAVRMALEALVAKAEARRSQQGRSVYYVHVAKTDEAARTAAKSGESATASKTAEPAVA